MSLGGPNKSSSDLAMTTQRWTQDHLLMGRIFPAYPGEVDQNVGPMGGSDYVRVCVFAGVGGVRREVSQ